MPDFHSAVVTVAILVAVPAFWFAIEHSFGWRIFGFLPPLLWIYATPLGLLAAGILPAQSPVYPALKQYLLPVVITLMVMTIDLPRAIRAVRTALPLMLIGTAGIILGAPVAYAIVGGWLGPTAWSGYGALAGSWIGGTANLAATGAALGTPPEQLGLAILTDQVVFLAWLPLLIMSRNFAEPFNRWTRAVPSDELDAVDLTSAAGDMPPRTDLLICIAAALLNSALAALLAPRLPDLPPFLNESSWNVLLTTSGAIALSFTPIRRTVQGATAGNALLYVFVATMGASASLSGLGDAPIFIAGGFIWVAIHGAAVMIGARLLRADVHTAALASIANVGGVASAPVVAAAHRASLVPAAVLLAMIGNVIGNYGAILAGQFCRMVGAWLYW